MVCHLSCGIATIFLVASFFTSYGTHKTSKSNEFKSSLNETQRENYEKIVNQRKNIYLQGLVVGFIVSICVIIFTNKSKNMKSLFKLSTLCTILAITFIVNYFYYILYPKNKYIVSELTNKTQLNNWLEIYKLMQFRYHLGFGLGLIGVAIFSHMLC